MICILFTIGEIPAREQQRHTLSFITPKKVGLAEGETVITHPDDSIRHGTRVRLR